MYKYCLKECFNRDIMSFSQYIFFTFRLLWSWNEGVKILQGQDIQIDRNKLQADQIMPFIEQRL